MSENKIKKIHKLKTDPLAFSATWAGKKLYEIRFNDRNFELHDALYLQETAHSGIEMGQGKELLYTSREIYTEIEHLLFGPIYGLKAGWVIMGIPNCINLYV